MAALNLICFALVLTPLTQAKIEPENIVGIWLFDQGAGKMAQDSSDNGNHGALKGGVKWVEGKFGKALAFDGNDDWVNMGDNPILKPETNADGNVTFMAWYKWEGGRYVLSSGGQTSSTGIAITHDPDAQKIWFGVNTGKKSAGTGYTPHQALGKGWHHLAGSYDDKKEILIAYIDGKVLKQVKASTKPLENKWQELHIGKPNNVGNYFIKAIIDEVAIFNVAFDKETINTIMTKGLEGALAISSAGKLAAAWASVKSR